MVLPLLIGAKNGTRTRDPDLGKVVLYQLSYFRDCGCKGTTNFGITKSLDKFFLKIFRAENHSPMASRILTV